MIILIISIWVIFGAIVCMLLKSKTIRFKERKMMSEVSIIEIDEPVPLRVEVEFNFHPGHRGIFNKQGFCEEPAEESIVDILSVKICNIDHSKLTQFIIDEKESL